MKDDDKNGIAKQGIRASATCIKSKGSCHNVEQVQGNKQNKLDLKHVHVVAKVVTFAQVGAMKCYPEKPLVKSADAKTYGTIITLISICGETQIF